MSPGSLLVSLDPGTQRAEAGWPFSAAWAMRCDNFEVKGDWAWARGRYGELSRTLVAGPAYLLDVVELSAADDRLLELPLHLSGRVEVKPAGSWVPAELPDEFVSGVERFAPASPRSAGIALLRQR